MGLPRGPWPWLVVVAALGTSPVAAQADAGPEDAGPEEAGPEEAPPEEAPSEEAGPEAAAPEAAPPAETPAPPEAAPAPPPPAPRPPAGKPAVLVLNVQPAAGVTVDTTRLLDDLVAVHMDTKEARLDVTAYNDVKQMLDLEGEKQQAGCDQAACLSDIAGAMGAQYVISGRLGKLGTRYLLTFTLFDSTAADNLARVNVNVDSLDELTTRIPPALDELVGAIPVDGAVAPAPVPAADPVDDGEANFWAIGTSGGLAACGGLLMAGGVGFDLINYWGAVADPNNLRGANGTFDPQDVVGPLACGCGGLVVLSGLALFPLWTSEGDAQTGDTE